QQVVAVERVCDTVDSDDGAVGQYIDRSPACALRPAGNTLAMEHRIHRRRAGARPAGTEQAGKQLGVPAPAFEARPVAGGECGHLVEKEQLGVAVPPYVAVATFEVEPTTDPLLRGPAARRQAAGVVMQTPAAIA